jgi:hypothetical protein
MSFDGEVKGNTIIEISMDSKHCGMNGLPIRCGPIKGEHPLLSGTPRS